jgi:flagellar biosynthetic protein FlhB
MAEHPGGERTEEATPKKRQEARKKGQVAKSTDLTQAVTMLVIAMMIPGVCQAIGSGFIHSMSAPERLNTRDASYSAIMGGAGTMAQPIISAAIPLLLVIMVVGIAANVAQVGFLFSGESLKPEFRKINPFEGLKKLFSFKSVFEGMKASAKLLVFSGLAWGVIRSNEHQIVAMAGMTPSQSAALVGGIAHTILTRLAAVWLVLAAIDYGYQRFQHEKQLKMTKQELRQEMKDQEGSPEVKSARYHARRRLMKGGLANRIREADVVVANPTHFAIAIKYDRSKMHAPIIIAKGQDYLALKIREIAENSDIPVVENKPLARALYKHCEVGDYVPREHFTAVAEVLAYVYRTMKRVKISA